MGRVAAACCCQSGPAPCICCWVTFSPSVAAHPMFSPLILIRSQRWAWAAFFVRPASPAFAATYGARNAWPPWESMEMTLTMVPGSPRCLMSAIAACIRKNGARRLTAMCWSNSSGVVSSMVPRVVGPAVPLDRRRDGGPCLGHVADVGSNEDGVSAGVLQLSRNLLAVLGAAAGQYQRGAFARGGPGDPGAETLSAAADQQHLAFQQVLHVDSSAVVARCAICSQPGLATAAGTWPVSTSRTPCAASTKVAALACRLIPIRWGVSTTSGWSKS